jgi:tetratricopeptide (TPR) repeat protein
MGAVFFGLSFTTTGDNALSLLIGGILFLALGMVVLVFTVLISTRTRRAKVVGEALAKQLLAEGKVLPVPALPVPSKAASPEDLLRIEGYARELNNIPWGDHPRIPDDQVALAFNQTVATTRRIAGDWSRLSEPMRVFAALPRPYCHVGAAEAMFRLSFMHGSLYAAVGLRQGMRFVTRAALHTPLQPDSLVIQVKLLAACRAPSWQKYATQAVELAQREAPNHPRLANAMMFYHNMRGAQDQALMWADRAIASGPLPEDVYAARSGKANILAHLERYNEALAVYDECLREDPRDPWAWHNTSIYLAHLGRYHEALECNQRALSIMDFGMARKQREFILAKIGSGSANG